MGNNNHYIIVTYLHSKQMFNKSKIIKREGEKLTELDEQVAKSLTALEGKGTKLTSIFVNSVDSVEYTAVDKSKSTYILIRIPFRSLNAYNKVATQVIEHLEAQFQWPCLVVANRTIISKRSIHHPSQMRPRSRTLKAVHAAILNDVARPSTIVGRRQRIMLDPLDRDAMEPKLDALTHAYHALTTHKVTFEFAKPNANQQRLLDVLREKNAAARAPRTRQ